MKKIISGLLIFASLAGGMSAVTSCKDSDDDQFAELQREDYRLMEQLQAMQQAIEEAKQQYTIDLNKAIDDLEKAIASGYVSKTDYDKLVKRVEELESKVCTCGDVAAKLTALETAIKQWVKDQGYLTQADISDFITMSALDGYLKEADLDKKIAALLGNEGSDLYKKLVELGLGSSYDDTDVKEQLNQLRKAIEELGFTVTVNEDGTVTMSPPSWAANIDEEAIAAANWVATQKTTLEAILKLYEEGKLDTSNLVSKDELDKYYTKDVVDQMLSTYATKDYVDSEIAKVKADITRLDGLVSQLQSDLTKLASDLTALDGKVTKLETLLDDYETWRAGIDEKVAANKAAISELQQKYSLVNERLDAMITSMTAEGTVNPVFGTFAAPVGMASNVLMTYVGEMNSVDFPGGSQNEFDGTTVLTELDYATIVASVTPQTYDGIIVPGKENGYVGNAGTLYFTVNPGNVSMAGKTFTLVNSQNEASTVTLSDVQKSDKVLTFGYSRAGEDVSLYEAKATLPADEAAIAACRVTIDEGLKDAATNYIRNATSASDLAGLMSAVYEQFNGILPRLAVKAEWTYPTTTWDDATATWIDATENGIARSGLDIAAASFKPLSYATLEGKSINRKLPILSEINIDWDKLIPEIKRIEIGTISVEDVTYDFSISAVDVNVYNTTTISVTVTVNGEGRDDEGNTINITATGTAELKPDDLQSFVNDLANQIEQAFNDQMGHVSDQLNEQFKKILNQLADKINNKLIEAENEINEMVQKLVNDLKANLESETGKLFDKLNSFINKYNSLANRINNVLDNPNHYLQVTMVFKNSQGGFNFLSTNEGAPTNFVLAGGNSIMLYPTSYSGEIIAPAFKKLVIVCDAINLETGASAQGGDADAKAALDKANNNPDGNFGCIVDGSTLRVAPGVLTPGYKYVVAYQALDYRGKTSTNKYYFTVK